MAKNKIVRFITFDVDTFEILKAHDNDYVKKCIVDSLCKDRVGYWSVYFSGKDEDDDLDEGMLTEIYKAFVINEKPKEELLECIEVSDEDKLRFYEGCEDYLRYEAVVIFDINKMIK